MVPLTKGRDRVRGGLTAWRPISFRSSSGGGSLALGSSGRPSSLLPPSSRVRVEDRNRKLQLRSWVPNLSVLWAPLTLWVAGGGAGEVSRVLHSWGQRGLSSGASAMEPAAPALTEEDMAEVKKDALENLRVYLCEKIIAERHFDHLRAKKILTREDTEEISCRTSSKKRAGKLLDYLQENPKGLDTLVESIRREKTQSFLIGKIIDEVQKLKIVKLEYLKGLHCSYMPHPPGATNSLSRLDSNECNFSDKLKDGDATVVYHPTGESSTASFYSNSTSLNLPVVEVGRTENSIFSTPLPGPGDPGAPPLPLEPQSEEEGNSTDMFLPLRSRSFCQQ